MPVDSAYSDIIAGLDQEPAPPREVGLEPIPRFDFYHVRFTAATSGVTQKGTPFVRPVAEVLAGPHGSVGRLIADDLYLHVKDTINEIDATTGEGIERPKTAEEYATGVARLRKTLRRIGDALAFPSSAPATLDEGTMQTWASNFVGREAVVAIRVEKARGNFDARNRIVWLSLAAPNDPPKKPNGSASTALDEAKERIARFNAKQRGTTLGRTVGGIRPKGATLQ